MGKQNKENAWSEMSEIWAKQRRLKACTAEVDESP